MFGRSLRTRIPAGHPAGDSADRVYLFAHETLRAIAERELDRDLGPYRRRIDQWADEYRARGWPDRTPWFLLRPYGRLLGTSGPLDRLISFATDAARHDRMLADTYGDAAALAEITTAQQLLLAQPVPDLVALGHLAFFQDRLAMRSRNAPPVLARLWARVGQAHRAEVVARGIADPDTRARALAAVAQVLAADDRESALGLLGEAEQVIRSPLRGGWVVRSVVEALAAVKEWDRAEQAARTIPDSDDQLWAWHAIVDALIAAKEWDRAEQTARAIPKRVAQARALARVAEALVGADRQHALDLADEAGQIVPSVSRSLDEYRLIMAWRGIVQVLIAAGEWDRAEQTAHAIPFRGARAALLAAVASTLAGADRERALGLLGEAEQTARAIRGLADPVGDHHLGDEAWQTIVQTLIAVGEWDRAEQTARTIPDPGTQAGVLAAVARALAKAGRDRARDLAGAAEQAARNIFEPIWQAQALVAVAAESTEWCAERARDLIGEAADVAGRATDTNQFMAWEAIVNALTEPKSGTAPSRPRAPSPTPMTSSGPGGSSWMP